MTQQAIELNTITLTLNGEVSLQDFAEVMTHFQALIAELSQEVVGAEVNWVIADLDAATTTATIAGISAHDQAVRRVVEAFALIGECLANSDPLPFSNAIKQAAQRLVSVADRGARVVIFRVGDRESLVFAPIDGVQGRLSASLGTVTGRVALVSSHQSLRFTLYDDLFNKAVVCYFAEEMREAMRGAWGKRVTVTGRIWREPITGRAVRVDEITEITVLPPPNPDPDSYRAAAGAWGTDFITGESPEALLRRLRDDE